MNSPRRRFLPRPTPLARAVAAAWLLSGPLALQAAGTLPTGLQVVAGQANVSTQGATMTVRNSAGAILNWQSFSIGAGNQVWFEQASAASKVLNRVTGNDPSMILGRLGSNGQVWLLNPNGVLFGASARVDVAGLVTGTLRLNDNDFLAGRFRFDALAGDTGFVRNEGALSTSFGGQVVLLAPQVENTGLISAPGGSVTLAAAHSVDLVDTGLPNLAVRVNKPAGEALNLGRLMADGGKVDVYGAIVNQQGLVQADTLGPDASGQVVLRAAETLTLGEASVTQAAGGQVDLLGRQVGVLGQAVVDVSSSTGGGGIRLGGGLQGQDGSVPNARAVFFGPEATLRADATGAFGRGGRIVIWSDEATRAYGTLSARGGTQGGDGGFVETSGGWLDARPAQVDVSTRSGRAGTWLLDPNDITINNAGPDTNISGGPVFTSTNDASVLSTATLAAALNAGNTVTVSTGTGGTNLQAGDIVMDAATLLVNPSAAASLTLSASRDVIVRNSTITASGQPFGLALIAAGGGGVGAIEVSGSTITAAGGNVVLRGATPRQANLPGGGQTAPTNLTQGYDALAQTVTSKLTDARIGINIQDSRFNLGAGSFTAFGLGGGSVGAGNGVVIGAPTPTGGSVINAGTISVTGYGASFGSSGIVIRGAGTDLTASAGMALDGAGTAAGVDLGKGARVTLTAPGQPLATLRITGESNNVGVSIGDASLDATINRGTPITVAGGQLIITGREFGTGTGVSIDAGGTLGSALPTAPTLALSGASRLQIDGSSSEGGPGVRLARVRVAGPGTGTHAITAIDSPLQMEQAEITAGGSLSLTGSTVDLSFSSLAASTGTLNLTLDTAGTIPTGGVHLANSFISTNGGDLQFGHSQVVCSAFLGCTTAPAIWVTASEALANYAGTSTQAALWIEGSSIDAGTGRVFGGGASDELVLAPQAGVTLDTSVINAREITLAGRSDTQHGVFATLSTLTTDRVLSLDGLSAQDGASGVLVGNGNQLQMVDPARTAGSRLSLTGQVLGNGFGVQLSGGALGSAAETHLVVNGGQLVVDGTNNGQFVATRLSGLATGSGGLLVDALGATGVTLTGNNLGDQANGAAALWLSDMNLLGPQANPGSTMTLTALFAGLTGVPAAHVENTTLSSAGQVSFVTDGLAVINSRLSGDAGLSLMTDTSATGRLAASVSVTGSTLTTGSRGTGLLIAGNGGDAVRGDPALNGGAGITLTDSTLRANDLNGKGNILLVGRGADAGGSGVVFTRTPMQAGALAITGTGVVDGDGVFSEDASGGRVSLLQAFNIDIQGTSASIATLPTRAGVRLGNGVQLTLEGGRALISGDSAVLGSDAALGGTPFRADGFANEFTVSTTDSMRLRNAAIDFGFGFAGALNLRADSDDVGGGRVRLENTLLASGGGDITVYGVGVRRGVGLPTVQNTTVLEGAIGAFLQDTTVDAAGGTVTVTGIAPNQGNPPPGFTGNSGLATFGANSINGGRIDLIGSGGDLGVGIDIGGLGAGSTLNLTAGQINLTGSGIGADPDTQQPYAGVLVNSASLWSAPGGQVTLTSLFNPLELGGLNIDAAFVQANSAGGLLIANSQLTASVALQLDGQGLAGGSGVTLGLGARLSGATVDITGQGFGAAGVTLADDANGLVQATGGALNLTGRTDTGAGIAFAGAYTLRSGSDLNLATDNGLQLPTRAPLPVFDAGQNFRLAVNAPLGVTLANGAGTALDATALSASLAGLQPTATTTLSVTGNPNALAVTGQFTVPSRLKVLADGIELQPGALLRSTAPGDGVVIGGTTSPQAVFLLNTAGAGAVSAPNGRWLLRLQDPRTSVLGGLDPDFSAYNLDLRPWAEDGAGNLITPAANNGVGYGVGTPAITGLQLTGNTTRVYDAGTAVTLSPATWTLAGLLPGNTMTLSGVTTAQLPDKNVGINRPLALDAGSVFSFTDANGKPVFGYDLPAFSASITPRAVSLVGAAAAGKVYDGTLTASMASLGTVTPLAGDVVTVGGTVVALFGDKNVGIGKTVTATGIALTGADAANYTLIAPGTFTADISQRPLAVTGLTALSRSYDTTTLATLTGTAAINAVAGDAVTLAGTPNARFADKNAGIAKPITVSGLSITGADAGNYALQAPALTADITPALLAVGGLTAASRVYDASTVVAINGTAGITPLAGDTVSLAGTATGAFATKNVGTAKPVTVSGLTLAGADAANYALQLPANLTADVTPATLVLQGVASAGKVYDGGTAAPMSGALAGVLGADNVTLNLSGVFADANAGTGKAVNYTATFGGLDAGNYRLSVAAGSTTATITPAVLSYLATPASGTVGQVLPPLSGSVIGFVAGETLATATTGTLSWTTNASLTSPAGRYAVTGSGLSAVNYSFVQDPSNAFALTLRAPATADAATNATNSATATALAAVQVPLEMSTPTQGRVLDVTLAFAPPAAQLMAGRSAAEVAAGLAALSAGAASDGLTFQALDWSRLSRDEIQTLLAARARYKQKVFAKGVYRLQEDPALADVRACRSEAELQSGQCLITAQLKAEIQSARQAAQNSARPRKDGARKVKTAALPTIERKLALLIGVNKYQDKRVPELMGAVPDARAVRTLLESRLGYETTVLENPSREAIVRAFNKLALDAEPNDSVIVYYAGHGVLVPIADVDTGFWLPSDADAETPGTWLANADIARMIAAVGARQLMLVSDSCYSGTLAGRERVQVAGGDDATELLTRKAAVIMSSGGDEPVADQGREGHSVFAWHFMRALEGLDRWQVGGNLYERVRAAVQRDFPQTPQYGASRSAGHQGNTDYLFERREIEAGTP